MSNKIATLRTKVAKSHSRTIAQEISIVMDFVNHSKPYVALMIILIFASSFIGLPVKDLPGCLLSLVISILNVYVGYKAITRYIEIQKAH
jgi:hypothetical protein